MIDVTRRKTHRTWPVCSRKSSFALHWPHPRWPCYLQWRRQALDLLLAEGRINDFLDARKLLLSFSGHESCTWSNQSKF